jgi:hypothetical protein
MKTLKFINKIFNNKSYDRDFEKWCPALYYQNLYFEWDSNYIPELSEDILKNIFTYRYCLNYNHKFNHSNIFTEFFGAEIVEDISKEDIDKEKKSIIVNNFQILFDYYYYIRYTEESYYRSHGFYQEIEDNLSKKA